MFSRPLATASVLLLLLGLAGCGDEPTEGDGPTSESAAASDGADAPAADGTCGYEAAGVSSVPDIQLPPAEPTATGKIAVTADTSAGELHLSLNANRAPCTVNSFLSLMEQGYFDNTNCHRMTTEPSQIFVLQCGDPEGQGYGGPGYTIPDELKGDESYGPGVLAMANTGLEDSGGSQFFIVYDDSLLDASYTVFGTVDAATLQIIENVAADGTSPPADGKPNTPVDIASVALAERKGGGKQGGKQAGDPQGRG